MRSADSSAPSTLPGVGAGIASVPPAWVGVWDVYEQTVTGQGTTSCQPLSGTTRTYRDTLCAGGTFQTVSF
jgi:hypothetical protein